MGVSALNRVIIITFFTVGFLSGLIFSAMYEAVASATRPTAGSGAAALRVLEVGNSTIYVPKR